MRLNDLPGTTLPEGIQNSPVRLLEAKWDELRNSPPKDPEPWMIPYIEGFKAMCKIKPIFTGKRK